ncbi:Glycoside hydrolase family 30 protein [Mycena indigotica]|uniref:Glycoside hydrolase family 30 protein n=1 Tax=Mycena indigotica TaxID=2126181 RepID=A0A8H6RY93_9AGAR|nr:Glycoside hydrolase family 30 protein [Mycena indigotica]KAF7288878.1 Glycoside hydrolase family 30 protein [Mycena indigotica]
MRLFLHTATLLGSALLVAADTTTTINAKSNYGSWDGWGTSLAWWAKAFGTQTALADIFFTRNTVSFNGYTLPGLGLNIIRYNAGASSSNADPNGDKMIVSPNIKASRQIDAYWVDWTSTSPNTSSWIWNVDANQRNMMSLAVARGANLVELFSNSPVWWMCYNLNPSGSTSGSSDNLESWNYDQHAIYLANIAQYAQQHWGITFTSVEAFNEPSATYWVGPTGTQEGCHFDVSTMSTVIGYLRNELNSRGLSNIIVSASDEETYDLATSTLNGLTSTAVSQIARVNVHGYQYGGGRRDTLYSAVTAKGKKLWNSEYGESDATGASLASNLLLDFVWLHPTAWVYWQVLDVSGWGLITANNDAKTVGAPSQKYFVLAQFTRHIRPGMRILDAGASNAVAAYDASARKLVIVAVNTAAAQYLNFDLSGFSTPSTNGSLVQRWATQIGSGGMQYQTFNDTFMSGTKFWSRFDQNVIMSFEVSNVVV